MSDIVEEWVHLKSHEAGQVTTGDWGRYSQSDNIAKKVICVSGRSGSWEKFELHSINRSDG